MDTNERTVKPLRRWFGAAGLIGAGLLAGGVLAGSLSAGAATSSTPAGSASTSANANGSAPRRIRPRSRTDPVRPCSPARRRRRSRQPRRRRSRARTIIRVETDSSGAAYEAHMKKADGSFVTVKLDSDFKVVSTVSGFGGGPGAPGSGA